MFLTYEMIHSLKSFESFQPKPYDDGSGNITIGYGHTRSAVMPASVTTEEAEQLLEDDLTYFSNEVREVLRVPLNENQFSACVMLAFNIGMRRFKKSTLLKLVNKGEFLAAAGEFEKWNKVTVNGIKKRSVGLVRRRAAEAMLFIQPPRMTAVERQLGLEELVALLSAAQTEASIAAVLSQANFRIVGELPLWLVQTAIDREAELFAQEDDEDGDTEGISDSTEGAGSTSEGEASETE